MYGVNICSFVHIIYFTSIFATCAHQCDILLLWLCWKIQCNWSFHW